MHIGVKNIKEADCACDVLILPFVEEGVNPYSRLKPSISRLIDNIRKREFKAGLNEVLLVPTPEDIKPERILFVGMGKKDALTAERVRQAGGKALACLRDKEMKTAALSTILLDQLKQPAVCFVEGALLGLYTHKKYKSDDHALTISSLILISKPSKGLSVSVRKAEVIASAVAFAKDLVNAPANDMTPADLADAACSLKRKDLSVKVLEKKDMQKIGMGAFLAVSYGSREQPKFIVAEYRGSRKPPVVLIGKSVTFDSGGLSLKPSDGMEKMKYDMAGGAAVLGVVKAAAELKLPVHLICLLPATENLPGGSAIKPGDVVRSISGKTIEIANTDAEGRLAVADAIEYAKRFKPRAIIDIATLTGACAVAFGGEVAAMMGNDRKFLDEFRKAGEETYERVWELPLFEEYKEYLKSDIADIRNIGNRIGSLMASAYFLYEFAGQSPWVHIDIAGTAWVDKDRPYIPKGATGIGVRLILNLIERVQ
ncbi:MAG: leucyl aminopeptidase [Nitrospirae bacterium]|nr:leucyl aminopeptidase [Nitrospirota bacterium]